jgi:hypothetical protein
MEELDFPTSVVVDDERVKVVIGGMLAGDVAVCEGGF